MYLKSVVLQVKCVYKYVLIQYFGQCVCGLILEFMVYCWLKATEDSAPGFPNKKENTIPVGMHDSINNQ